MKTNKIKNKNFNGSRIYKASTKKPSTSYGDSIQIRFFQNQKDFAIFPN